MSRIRDSAAAPGELMVYQGGGVMASDKVAMVVPAGGPMRRRRACAPAFSANAKEMSK